MDRIRGLRLAMVPGALALLAVLLFFGLKGRVSEFHRAIASLFPATAAFCIGVSILVLNTPAWRERRGLFREAARKWNAEPTGGFYRPLVFEAKHPRGTLRIKMGVRGEAGSGRQVVAVDSTWIALQGVSNPMPRGEVRSDGGVLLGASLEAALRLGAYSSDGVARIETGGHFLEARLVGYLTDRNTFDQDLTGAIRALEDLYVALTEGYGAPRA